MTDGLLQSNPVEKVEAAAHQKEPPDPFTNEEAERIMAEFNAPHPGQVANLVRTVKLNSRALAALRRQRRHTQIVGEEIFQDPRHTTPWADERALRRSYLTPVP